MVRLTYFLPSRCRKKKKAKSHSTMNPPENLLQSVPNTVSGELKNILRVDETSYATSEDNDVNIILTNVFTELEKIHRSSMKSTWYTDMYGVVKIAEICYYSVTGSCRYENTGCSRLHANQHYYWQFCNIDRQWFNLPLTWVNALEEKYIDPSQEQVSLPKIDGEEIMVEINRLFAIKGRDPWTANIQSMDLVSSDRSIVFKLRRLCTEKIPGLTLGSSNFLWYFLDGNSIWMEYGKADSSGDESKISSITSSQIESHFMSKPHLPLFFSISEFTYTLDTSKMIQTNQKTKVGREVRRRPAWENVPSNEKLKYDKKNDKVLPSFWNEMQPKERVCRVPLSSDSEEYNNVIDVLNGEISTDNLSKIERIQNPFLWRAFQNKVEDMELIYGDKASVNIRQLFHGTKANVVDNIINENFDWRLHGTSTGQLHGQGTYFSTKASESHGYCQPDSQGKEYLFIARVAVGTITRGDATMTRPPINPETNAPYDSTGGGSVIVKYDKQEYYPEYIVTLKR